MNLHSIILTNKFFNRFGKFIPFNINIINHLLQINNSETVRPQDCLPEVENQREQAFQASINRKPLQFE